MNEDILKEYNQYLRQEHGSKKNTVKAYYDGIKKYNKYINKPLEETTIDDLKKWKEHINQESSQNTRRIWLYGVNKFYKWFSKPEIKVTIPAQIRAHRKVFSEQEKDKFLETAKGNPLHNIIALGLYDEILRPGELIDLRISDIDFSNHMLYIKDSKVGNTSVPMSPRFEQSILDYMTVRVKPKAKYKDYLLIHSKSVYKSEKYQSTHIVRRITKKIAIKSGIKKNVTPYTTIKPSAITLRLNDKVNPRTVQRIARHKNISTTLIYDHSTDKDALDYLRTQEEIDYSKLPVKAKAQVLLEKLFNGDIDNSTFSAGLELLRPDKVHKEEVTGYA